MIQQCSKVGILARRINEEVGDNLIGQEDAHVLNRCDQVILDLLTPEPPPASSFEVMIVGRIGKTALDQVLAPSRTCLCQSGTGT